VRQVLEHIRAQKPSTGYTTVLKLMQIMTEKNLLARDEKERTHIYRPALRREQTQRQLAGELLDKVFGGPAAALYFRFAARGSAERRYGVVCLALAAMAAAPRSDVGVVLVRWGIGCCSCCR